MNIKNVFEKKICELEERLKEDKRRAKIIDSRLEYTNIEEFLNRFDEFVGNNMTLYDTLEIYTLEKIEKITDEFKENAFRDFDDIKISSEIENTNLTKKEKIQITLECKLMDEILEYLPLISRSIVDTYSIPALKNAMEWEYANKDLSDDLVVTLNERLDKITNEYIDSLIMDSRYIAGNIDSHLELDFKEAKYNANNIFLGEDEVFELMEEIVQEKNKKRLREEIR